MAGRQIWQSKSGQSVRVRVRVRFLG